MNIGANNKRGAIVQFSFVDLGTLVNLRTLLSLFSVPAVCTSLVRYLNAFFILCFARTKYVLVGVGLNHVLSSLK